MQMHETPAHICVVCFLFPLGRQCVRGQKLLCVPQRCITDDSAPGFDSGCSTQLPVLSFQLHPDRFSAYTCNNSSMISFAAKEAEHQVRSKSPAKGSAMCFPKANKCRNSVRYVCQPVHPFTAFHVFGWACDSTPAQKSYSHYRKILGNTGKVQIEE